MQDHRSKLEAAQEGTPVGVRMDEVPQPPVRRGCKTCLRLDPYWLIDGPGVISPTGVEHAGRDFGKTACGRHADGVGWWWPL